MARSELVRALPYLVMGGIFALSSIRGDRLPSPDLGFEFSDKVAHFVVFGFLLATFRPSARRRQITSEWLPGAIVACLLFAGLDEAHQMMVPRRHPDVLDLLADAAGIGVAAGVLSRWPHPRGCRILKYT